MSLQHKPATRFNPKAPRTWNGVNGWNSEYVCNLPNQQRLAGDVCLGRDGVRNGARSVAAKFLAEALWGAPERMLAPRAGACLRLSLFPAKRGVVLIERYVSPVVRFNAPAVGRRHLQRSSSLSSGLLSARGKTRKNDATATTTRTTPTPPGALLFSSRRFSPGLILVFRRLTPSIEHLIVASRDHRPRQTPRRQLRTIRSNDDTRKDNRSEHSTWLGPAGFPA